jgi:probable rRNA maturation factor
MLKINIINQYDSSKKYARIIKYILKIAEKKLDINDRLIVNVILVSDEEIREMNARYRNIDKTTDVLSFENQEGIGEIGDIFISLDKTKEQAETYGHDFARELAFLSVHGLLHCLGYDHLNELDEKEMFSIQDEILENSKYRRKK